ncbi:MAG: hypothetical protein LDL19_01295 [Thiobacillus sp.]|nr:hypothetical protein [Thiobacillus sp.]
MNARQKSGGCHHAATPAVRSRARDRNFLRFGARRVQARLHAVQANDHVEGFEGYLPGWLREVRR